MAKVDVTSRSAGGGRRITARAGSGEAWTPPNKRMHATADTRVVIYLRGVGRRVMRGVGRLLNLTNKEKSVMTSAAKNHERLAAVATIAATIISLLALGLSLYTYWETNNTQKRIAAFTFWQSYLERAAEKPEHANGQFNNADAKDKAAYEWFVANALGAAETVYLLQGDDPAWKATIQTLIRNHANYIRSPEFERGHYDPSFRVLIDETLK